MKKALASCCLIVLVAAVAVWFNARQQPTLAAAVAPDEPAPMPAQPIGVVGDARRVLPSASSLPVVVVSDAGAGVPSTPTSGDPLDAWKDVPLDQRGNSLGAKTKYFNRALIADAKGNLSGCVSHLKTPNVEIAVELFAEAQEGSVLVKHARIASDAGIDLYAARCIEAAFERGIPLDQPDVAVGRRYRFSYPLVVNADFSESPTDGG